MCRMLLLVLRPSAAVGRMEWLQREGSGVGENSTLRIRQENPPRHRWGHVRGGDIARAF